MAEEVIAGEFQLKGRERLKVLKMATNERARVYLPIWPKGVRVRSHYIEGLGRFECWGKDGAPGDCCNITEEEFDEHVCMPIMVWATKLFKDPKSGVHRLGLAKPVSFEVEMWRLGKEKYERVVELSQKGKNFIERDLELKCKDGEFQKLDIDPLDDCVFQVLKTKNGPKAEEILAKVRDFYERMKKTISRTVTKDELTKHLGGGGGTEAAAAEEDLNSIVDES